MEQMIHSISSWSLYLLSRGGHFENPPLGPIYTSQSCRGFCEEDLMVEMKEFR